MTLYSPAHMVILENITHRWQHNEPTTGSDMNALASMIENVSFLRWNVHFNGIKSDWGSTINVKENIPLALMDYIKTRKSIRTYSPNLCCVLDTPAKYNSLAYTLNEFRRQFPRIVSVLVARECGVQVMRDWQSSSYNISQLVHSTEHYELHLSLCLMRKLAKDKHIPLYGVHRYELLNDCFVALISKLRSKQVTKARPLTLDSCMEISGGNVVNRVMARRAAMVYAASDILAVRSHSSFQHNSNYRTWQ